MLRSRSLSFTLALSLTVAAVSRGAAAQGAPPEVKTHMAAGDAAAAKKDWTGASTEYRAAYAAGHGEPALFALANALYQLKRPADAFEAYDELLRTFGDATPKAHQSTAEARAKELGAQLGTITVRSNEALAEVTLDDKSLGQAPVAPKHVPPGDHKVRVTRAGFTPFEQAVSVTAGGAVTVDAQLVREARKGHVVVKEKDGAQMRVFVDGLDVGATPWQGELDPGPHEVALRSSQASSTPQRVTVERGKTAEIVIDAVAATAHLEVKPSVPGAIVFFDGKPLAEGSFAGDVAPGEHVIAVKADGYERFEKKIALGPHGSEVVDARLEKSGAVATVAPEAPKGQGVYGGLGFAFLALPGGTGDELDTRCNLGTTDGNDVGLGASSCDRPMPLGGGMMGYVGYSFDPIGLELMLAGEVDQSSPTAHFSGDPKTGIPNPGVSGAPRTEEFSFLRAGGIVAIRARLATQTEHVRVGLAMGPGLAVKYAMLLERKTTLLANPSIQDVYAPKGVSYLSPAFTVDASVQWRIGRPTALALGILAWMESASIGGQDVRAPGDAHRSLGGPPPVGASLTTPPYQIASGAQIFVGPYIGLQFGP